MLDRYPNQSISMVASTTFSLFFPPLPKVGQWPDEDDHSSITTSPSSPSSSSTGSVDCTLSLGTPSSRRASAAAEPMTKHVALPPPAHPSYVAWDDVVGGHQSSDYCRKPAGGAAKAGAHDAFADRRCANCGTSSTPLWRNGPRGPKSLCNACGIRFKKEERRAAATAAMETGAGASAGCGYSAQRAQYEYAAAVARASPCEGSFPCGGGVDADANASANTNAPFLPWRLNVVAPAPAPAFAAVWPDRTSLFQYN